MVVITEAPVERQADEVADHLEEAGRLIRKLGLAKECGEDARGRICALRALGRATGYADSYPDHAEVQQATQRALSDHLHLGARSIADWNDAPERTAEDVIGTLYEVASERRARR